MRTIRLLPIAFLFTGAVTFVDRGFNEEMTRLSGIRSQFTEAVGEAKGRLTAVSWAAISDPQIQQNFELGNMNTVSQSLQGYTRPGEVSQIDVLDADCNLLARVPQNGRPVSDICQKIKAGKPALVWQQNEQSEALLVSVVTRQIDGKPVFLASQLVFDQAWLSLHHNLATLSGEREISAGNGGGAVLWREGRMPDEKYALPLKVDGWIYRILPELTGLALAPMRESFWVLYGALGLVILLGLSQITAEKRKDEIERAQLDAWVREHQFAKGHAGSQKSEQLKTWTEVLSAARNLIACKDEQRAHQLRLMGERLDNISIRLRERDAELADAQSKIAEMSDLASLQQQLRHTTSSFLRQMNQMREICENIYDIASGGLGQQARGLHAFCSRWKEGLSQGTNREMGARKFFRSLVEARGSVPSTSKLDDDMREFELMTSSSLDQSVHVAILAKQALDGCEAASHLAAMWHGISTRNQSGKSSDWMNCLVSAQKLVNADDRYKTISFETLPQLGSPEEMYPPVTSAALVSGFFHLYLALVEDVNLTNIAHPLVARQKRFKEQATIILSLPARQAGAVPESPSRQMMYHVDIAKQILSSCGLKVSILPPTVAGYPVGLTWALPQREANVNILASKSQESTAEF